MPHIAVGYDWQVVSVNSPVLPHQGQGASQAIEDAEALGALLQTVKRDGVPRALERCFKIRYKRATFSQQISRSTGLGEMRRKYVGKDVQDDAPVNPAQFRDFSWNYFGALDWEKQHADWVLA